MKKYFKEQSKMQRKAKSKRKSWTNAERFEAKEKNLVRLYGKEKAFKLLNKSYKIKPRKVKQLEPVVEASEPAETTETVETANS